HQPLLDALLDRISRIEIGHSLDENTQLGPISNAPHYATLQTRIDHLRTHGATIHQPAQLPALDGFFLSPTIASGVDASVATAEL
ncbi:aldehyde dehydrogenase family protein, partial [Staphylococcus aureus]|uniref:aldehyde dehydrogenase family protein n=1 Tax=Staphylococcus aureus TaxID=1280 RepID=UPI0038B2C946